MNINHIAIWAKDIEKICNFYQKYFDGKIHKEYYNSSKKFRSRFITFDGDIRIEVMNQPDIESIPITKHFGWSHLAISVGSKKLVNELTAQLENDGIDIISYPRLTGDGYYESVIKDPEGNIIELTV